MVLRPIAAYPRAMHRLFAAIRLPADIRSRLADLMEGIDDARWEDEDQLHVTLRFIGEVDLRRAEDVASALASVHQERFALSLNGVGSFDRKRGAATLWAGVAPAAPLQALHKKIDHVCVAAGLEPERRAFHPHVTLARLKSGSRGLAPFMERAASLAGPLFPVDSFGLYESDLAPAGAIHSLIARYPLR